MAEKLSIDITSQSNAINESSASVREDFFKNNQDFYEKGLEASFKTLNNNIFSTINSTFANFSNEYEGRLDKNREAHEKAIAAFNKDLKKIKELYTNKKIILEKQEESVDYLLSRRNKLKIFSKIFRGIQNFSMNKIHKKMKNKIIIENFLVIKKKRKILTNWRNITNALTKGRIKLKYANIFNEKYNELQSGYMDEIKRLTDILQNLEVDIRKEIDERRALAKMYDQHMNKGVEVFVKETNAIVDFNSSSNIDFF
jgi:hypothetical protein